MADWYYARGGTHQGPVTPAQLRQMAQAGEIKPDDLVFQEGGTQWVAASTVKGLFDRAPGTGTAPAPANRSGISPKGESPRQAPAPSPAPASGQSSYWMDLLFFRRMIAPWIIMVLYWLNSALAVLSSVAGVFIGLATLFTRDAISGLGLMVLSVVALPVQLLVIRLVFELMILFFRMNETLLEIKESLARDGKGRG
jgi:hypothetical protein